MDNLNPPRVLIESNRVGLNESVRLDSLFSVFDADASSEVTEYQIRDNTEGGGHFTQGGRILEPTFGEFHVIPGDQIGSIRYVGGDSVGTDAINVRAFDGDFWSNTALGLITSGNNRPVLTAEDAVLSAGSSINIADLVQYSDAENNQDRLYYIVDRTVGANGGQLILSEDDTPNPQANWLLVNNFELAGTTYQASSLAGDSETLSIRAFDGFSWSEVVDFTISTSSKPAVINDGNQDLVTNERRLASDLFSLDADVEAVNPILSYLFVDRRPNATGGYFEFKGERRSSAEWFSVSANELDQLVYVGASVGNDLENIGIIAYNGFEFGDVQEIGILTLPGPVISAANQTVRAGHFLNFATGGTANIGGTIPESDTPIFEFLDASGDAIKEFLFVDRLTNGGHFVFKGAQVPSASWFRVPAEELDQLEYVGGQTGPTSEQIGVMVNTNFIWNDLGEFTINTIPNANAPIVTLPNISVRSGGSVPLESLFGWTDADGDNLRTVTFLDTDADAASGYFTINGVQQAAETSIVVPFDQIGTVNYVASSPVSSEEIQITVNDGLNNSETAVATISSIALPTIAGNLSDISLDTIERVFVSNLVTETSGGSGTIRYQVFDENSDSRSGRFELNGVDLQNGIVHNLTAAQYGDLMFKGAETDLGRQLDPIIIRSNDGNGYSEWERVNINTDPVGIASLDSGVAASDNLITYSFIDGGNQAGNDGSGGNRLPFYYVPPEGEDPGPEALAAAAGTLVSLSQEQRQTYREVLEFIERVIDVEFVEIPYNAATTTAESVIGAYPIPAFSGIGQFPDGDSVGNPGSDVFFDTGNLDFNPDTPTLVDLGDQFRFTAYQLTGLTLGLNLVIAAETPLSIFNNFDYLSVLSRQHDSVHNRFNAYPEPPASLALYDIEQLQAVYGANSDHNSGDNQYGNFFSGSDPHFVDNDEQHQTTLWDGGGRDTLNYTLHVADETIDLRQGTFSSINGVPQSLRISYETVIENARGGSGDDNIRGNTTDNFLFGNEGDDVLRGGGGNDVLRGGAGDDTYVWTLGDGRDFVQEFGEGGLDTLQVFDASGALSSLEDDLTFRRFGNDLRIDFTFNQGSGQGTVTIDDFGDETSRVEFLTIHNPTGTQIGETIDLQSIFDQATTLAQQFTVGAELATTLPVTNGAADENAFAALAIS